MTPSTALEYADLTPNEPAPAARAATKRSTAWLHFATALALYLLGCCGLFAMIGVSFGLYEFQLAPKLTGTTAGAVALGLGLVGLFGVQHTIMARPAFKRWWARVVPPVLHNSVFTLLSGLLILLILGLWQPLPQVVWHVETPLVATLLWVLKGAGWAYLLASTFVIGHFQLFGLAQPWRVLRGVEEPRPRFRERLMYRFDRHPIMTGVLIGLWATPYMRVDTLALAAIFTLYMAIGVAVEERTLLREHGAAYANYIRRVGSTVPGLRFTSKLLHGDGAASSRS